MIPPFQTLFAVALKCGACVKHVNQALSEVPGVNRVDADLEKQLVTVEGTAPPSKIVATIQSTGRDAILRGTGKPNSAAVAILETFRSEQDGPVRGLARMVQVADKLTIVDLTLNGLEPGTYHASVRAAGDITEGAESTGGMWEQGDFGAIEVGQDGTGSAMVDRPVNIWEMIGRSFVVSKEKPEVGKKVTNDKDTLVGVIARSAGVWENTKTVCSCSGKNIWEERKQNVDRGIN